VNDVLWHEESGAWLDYDTINNKHREYFVGTNLSPLWMKCYDPTKREHITDKILKYIETNELDKYPGGCPTTLFPSSEQWDYPNVWAPVQHMLIVGLDNLGDPRTQQKAQDWAQKWVLGNYMAYDETGDMYEKYNAEKLGGTD
jgi:alpha,alpha-trehalase